MSFRINKNIKTFVSYGISSYLPTGCIVPYAGLNAPELFLICDGSEISRTDYQDLFNVIGTIYGNGDGLTTFNLPNLKGRVLVSLDASQSEFNTLGETGGSKTHTLTVSEMPSHNHGGLTDVSGVHTHSITDPGHVHSSNATGGSIGLAISDGSNTVESTDSSPNELNVWTTPQALTINSTTTGITNQNAGAHEHVINSQGSNQAHNILQPYIVLNYIIKL